jgi:hypothetical protein
VYPTYARGESDAKFRLDLEKPRVSLSSLMVNRSTPTSNLKGSVGRIAALTSKHQPKRSFSTAAIGAFRLLKLLKHA